MSIVTSIARESFTSSITTIVRASVCSLMSWLDALTTNCSASFVGNELTITNDGGGTGSYFGAGQSTWTESSGIISGECRFKSDTAGTSTTNLYIVQGATIITALSYNNSTKVLFDIQASANVATGLTGGANYTYGIKFDQAGTATFSDSEGNSGSLGVDVAYSSATASFWSTGGGTGVSEVAVSETALGQGPFWLPASEGSWCSPA